MGNISGNRSPRPSWAPEGTRLLQATSMAPACFLPTPPPAGPGRVHGSGRVPLVPAHLVCGRPTCLLRVEAVWSLTRPFRTGCKTQTPGPSPRGTQSGHRDASSARQMWSRLVRGEWPASQLAGRHPLVNQQFEPCTCPDCRVTPSRLVITPVGPDRLGCCLPGASEAVGKLGALSGALSSVVLFCYLP